IRPGPRHRPGLRRSARRHADPGPSGRRPMNSKVARRWAPWLLLSALLLIALVYGPTSSGPPRTTAQRTQHIAAQLRCPVCEGQTVADSDALISRDIRGVIQQRVASGQSDSQIISFIVRQYPGTLLTPP